MSRYIDADALMEELKQHHDFFVKAWGGFREMPLSDKARCDELSNIMAEVFNAPSIEIITCGECKWFDSGKNDSEIWSMCTRHFGKYIDVNADDFCSYGERNADSNTLNTLDALERG